MSPFWEKAKNVRNVFHIYLRNGSNDYQKNNGYKTALMRPFHRHLNIENRCRNKEMASTERSHQCGFSKRAHLIIFVFSLNLYIDWDIQAGVGLWPGKFFGCYCRFQWTVGPLLRSKNKFDFLVYFWDLLFLDYKWSI